MPELPSLTPQERIERFELMLGQQLEQISRASTDRTEQDQPFKGVLESLRDAWSASRVSCWQLSENKVQGMHVFASGYGLPCLSDGISECPATQRLVELASGRAGILWVEPSSNDQGRRVFGRIAWLQPFPPSAVIELEYETSAGAELPLPRDAILVGMEHCLQMLARYATSMTIATSLTRQRCTAIDLIALEAFQQRRRLSEEFAAKLNGFTGLTLASFEEKQAFVSSIQALLEENGLRLECPTCGEPAILRCMKTGNSVHGCFLFDHRVGSKRTMHGGRSEIPRLLVTDRPTRAIRKLIVQQTAKAKTTADPKVDI